MCDQWQLNFQSNDFLSLRAEFVKSEDMSLFMSARGQFYRIYQSNGQQVGRQIDQTVGTYQKSAQVLGKFEAPLYSIYACASECVCSRHYDRRDVWRKQRGHLNGLWLPDGLQIEFGLGQLSMFSLRDVSLRWRSLPAADLANLICSLADWVTPRLDRLTDGNPRQTAFDSLCTKALFAAVEPAVIDRWRLQLVPQNDHAAKCRRAFLVGDRGFAILFQAL